mgnify:CR=1 FL=1
MPLEDLGIAVYNEEQRTLNMAFTSSSEIEDEVEKEIHSCYSSKTIRWNADKRLKCLPLCVEVGGEKHCVGVMALRCVSGAEGEDDRLFLELVCGYVAIVVYNAVKLVASKYRDIELAEDESRRLQREENQLHVQNMVLDNCLSTIKHETIYYPNRIKQIIGRLGEASDVQEERRQVETIAELVAYYKEVFTILSSCAARQLEEVTFRRGVVKAEDLKEAAHRYFKLFGWIWMFKPSRSAWWVMPSS